MVKQSGKDLLVVWIWSDGTNDERVCDYQNKLNLREVSRLSFLPESEWVNECEEYVSRLDL